MENKKILQLITYILIGNFIHLGGLKGKYVTRKHDKKHATCTSAACHNAALMILKNMNTSINPCENFYEFTCGKYIKFAVIPDYKGTVNIPHTIANLLEKQIRRLLEGSLVNKEPRPYSLAKILYKTCMNSEINDHHSEALLYEYLNKFGGWPVLEGKQWKAGSFDWQHATVALHTNGFRSDQFLRLYAYLDPINSNRTIAFVHQAALGLGREYLSRGLVDPLVRAYRTYMIDIAVMLGADTYVATAQLNESLAFEMKLANISLPRERLRNLTALCKHVSIAQLQTEYPMIEWPWFIGTLLYGHNVSNNEIIVLQAPDYIRDLLDLMRTTTKRVQANYLFWRVVESTAGLLSDRLRRRQLSYARIASGAKAPPSRWRECVVATNGGLPLAVGAMYVRKYFNKESRTEAAAIVRAVRKQLGRTLLDARWMDERTRGRALRKLRAMRSHVGYPDELLNNTLLQAYYANLNLLNVVYLENVLKISRFERLRERNSLHWPVNKSDWTEHGSAAVVNAFYTFAENSINVPAGILQGAFFSMYRPKYLNYGAIGTVIGHEMIHGYDDRGRQYDTAGNLADWWEPATNRNFVNKSRCFVNQYGEYIEPQVGLNLNGINTQGENIADNGGAKAAYLAYERWAASNNWPEPPLPRLQRFSARQMFWISMAGAFCSRSRPEYARLAVTTDEHAPAMFRVLGTLRNLPQFARDFGCAAGTRMNPTQKCTLW